MMFNFEKLETWHKAIEFPDGVYGITKSFLETERFGLTSQLRRAAVSVSANIAEESSRSSHQDFIRFLEMATGSLFEVVSQLKIARNRKFLVEPDYRQLCFLAEELVRMLSGLRKSLRESPA
jgi:four helix bundle protein